MFIALNLFLLLFGSSFTLLGCCKFDLHSPEANFCEDLESKIVECVRNTLDKRVQFYEDEIRKLSEQRFMPVWNFCNFFILKVVTSSHYVVYINVIWEALWTKRNWYT